jgi:hypothetical protein
MTDDERRELRDLMQAHDRMMIEDQEWMARREAASGAPVQKSDEPAVLYREHYDSAPASAGAETDEWAGWNAWMRGHLDIERQSIRGELEGTLVRIIVELRKEWREEVTKAVAERDAEIAHLRGQVEVLTRLYAGKSADVVDLPNWKPKDVA